MLRILEMGVGEYTWVSWLLASAGVIAVLLDGGEVREVGFLGRSVDMRPDCWRGSAGDATRLGA